MSIAEKLVTIAENEPKVYEAGQKAEYDRFWDSFQTNGNRRNYANGFSGVCWTNDTYNPKYPIIVTGIATNMFTNNTMINYTKKPITIDTTSAQYVFMGASRLKEINTLKVTEKVSFNGWFSGCTALETINFTTDSVIANNISFAECTKLTHESLMSIINALKDFSTTETFANVDYYWDGNYPYEHTPQEDFVYNVKSASFSSGELQLFLETDTDLDLVLVANDINYSGDLSKIKTAMISSDGTLTLTFEPTTTKTLTIGSTNLAKLTDGEKAIATQKGWTIA